MCFLKLASAVDFRVAFVDHFARPKLFVTVPICTDNPLGHHLLVNLLIDFVGSLYLRKLLPDLLGNLDVSHMPFGGHFLIFYSFLVVLIAVPVTAFYTPHIPSS
ncbi:unnamed protein product [Meganyctiphanes norvegica]|uniref:Uncharacterized protein n=1 Tax=Meganyctiphanes norvegica TaxID=48144 RepID=A0AAV2RVE6_MEGNR